MTDQLHTRHWKRLKESSGAVHYAIDPRIVAVVPHDGSVDDERTARQNVAFVHAYFAERGVTGVAIVFADRLRAQTRRARTIYARQFDPGLVLGSVVLGGTLPGRVVGTLELALRRPTIPIRMFGDLGDALSWAHDRFERQPLGMAAQHG